MEPTHSDRGPLPLNMVMPLRASGVSVYSVGAETVVHNEDRKRISVLNRTADVIWECCDGKQTVGDALSRLAQRFNDVDKAILMQGMRDAIDRFEQESLLDGWLGWPNT